MELHRITLRQLQYLVALHEAGSYRKAADLIGISQPSLSAQIHGAEEVLDTKLVERGRRGAIFTPTGREVLDRAHQILDQVQAILDLTAGREKGFLGTIRLGAKPTLGPYLLPQVVARLHSQNPEMKLYVREGAPGKLEPELLSGIHDVILAQLPVISSNITSVALFSEPLYLACAKDHPLAAQSTVKIEDLENQQVLSLNPGYSLHRKIDAVCQESGAKLSRDYEGTSLDALRQMVGMGMGITFLPALYVRSEISPQSEVVAKRIEGRVVSRDIGLAWRQQAGRMTAYEELAELIRQVVAEQFEELIPR